MKSTRQSYDGLVHVELLRGRHPRPFVEPDCAGEVLGVDAEPDLRTPAGAQLGEEVQEQREGEAAATPRASHGKQLDPAQTIDNAGIKEGDILEVAPILQAGT